MSRSDYLCANAACRDPQTGRKAVLGVIRNGRSLALPTPPPELHLDCASGRALIVCPCCGTERGFRAGSIHYVPAIALLVELAPVGEPVPLALAPPERLAETG